MAKPDKINAILPLPPVRLGDQQFLAGCAVAFYNQVSVYGFVPDLAQISLIVDVYVQDVEEDILCLDYNEAFNMLAFAGKLGVTYVYPLGPQRHKA